MRDFFWNAGEKLLDGHSCHDATCKVCLGRFPRDLTQVFHIFASGVGAVVFHLFSKWHPSEKLLRQLAEAHLRVAWRNLSDIPAPDLEANRAYSIWDGPGPQIQDWL